jgi:ABC-type bacteriocin/lantibiotic exporter with double-glycine peptidase domain
MIYLAFIFALALACVAGMEFVCLMTMETRNRQLKQRISELERQNGKLTESLRSVKALLDQNLQEDDEETWPELIDDNSAR